MFKLLFLIIDGLLSLAYYLLGVGIWIMAGLFLVYGIYWLFILSPAGPYLISAVAILIILAIIGSVGGKKQEDQ